MQQKLASAAKYIPKDIIKHVPQMKRGKNSAEGINEEEEQVDAQNKQETGDASNTEVPPLKAEQTEKSKVGRLKDAAKSIGSYVQKKREEFKKGKLDEKFLYVS